MNLIPRVAEMLGVEIGEEFKLKDVKGCEEIILGCLYRFTETDFQFDNNGNWISTIVPTSLLKGIVEVEKIPFEPKFGETYYQIFIGLNRGINIHSDTWANWTKDYMCKYCGNCFRTEAEAEREKYNIYEKLTGRKWVEK